MTNTSQTNPSFWDCECEKNYIHSKANGVCCKGCGAWSDEGSDSLCTEIESQYTEANDLKLLKDAQPEEVYHGE